MSEEEKNVSSYWFTASSIALFSSVCASRVAHHLSNIVHTKLIKGVIAQLSHRGNIVCVCCVFVYVRAHTAGSDGFD